MTEIKINWAHKRSRHMLERMWLRGISPKEVADSIFMGKKVIKADKTIESFFKYFSVVYDEIAVKGSRKIYPITVKIW